MTELASLYVCHFSNGHIKVGRSINPNARISTHAKMTSCLGVELTQQFIVECSGNINLSESALISLCAEKAVKRNKTEWFEGLVYSDVCAWAESCARQIFQKPQRTKKPRGAEGHAPRRKVKKSNSAHDQHNSSEAKTIRLRANHWDMLRFLMRHHGNRAWLERIIEVNLKRIKS